MTKIMNVIDSNNLERDLREKPASTFSHPALAAVAKSAANGIREARGRSSAAEAAIAQLVEHVIRNDGVGGSNPSCGTNETSLIIFGLRALPAHFCGQAKASRLSPKHVPNWSSSGAKNDARKSDDRENMSA
jgi:hypothetical protein